MNSGQPVPDYARPDTLNDAVALLARGPAVVLAGGTDLYPGAAAGLVGPILDLTAIAGLRGISIGDSIRIGAATSWTAIAEARLPPALRALQQAARQVGGRQIQNAGTIGGNLCNASPAADGVPPLLAVGALVELASGRGVRTLPLAEFVTGARRTARAADEVLSAVLIPPDGLTGSSAFLKLGARSHLVISIAMVAARVQLVDGRLAEVAVAVGSCSAVARRLGVVEQALIGTQPDDIAVRVRSKDIAAALSPIDDIRATADYRLRAATELVTRALIEAAR
jgi:CO/xanthine dehydrogenase FAD-binding subunit